MKSILKVTAFCYTIRVLITWARGAEPGMGGGLILTGEGGRGKGAGFPNNLNEDYLGS